MYYIIHIIQIQIILLYSYVYDLSTFISKNNELLVLKMSVKNGTESTS